MEALPTIGGILGALLVGVIRTEFRVRCANWIDRVAGGVMGMLGVKLIFSSRDGV